MSIDARMDGTPLERAHWRINALREALTDIYHATPDHGARSIATNALNVDDMNATLAVAPT